MEGVIRESRMCPVLQNVLVESTCSHNTICPSGVKLTAFSLEWFTRNTDISLICLSLTPELKITAIVDILGSVFRKLTYLSANLYKSVLVLR